MKPVFIEGNYYGVLYTALGERERVQGTAVEVTEDGVTIEFKSHVHIPYDSIVMSSEY